MQIRTIEIVVGAFMLAGIISLAVLAIRVSGFNVGAETNTYSVYARFENIGGLVMPLPLRIEYADGVTEDIMLPAEIWRRSPHKVTRMLLSEQAIVSVELDPLQQIADTDRNNNRIPQQIQRSRIELYRSDNPDRNLMADLLVELEAAETGEDVDTGNDVPLEPTGD